MINAYWEELEFEIPPITEGNYEGWFRWIDTYLPAPDDIRLWTEIPAVRITKYKVHPRSMVILVARKAR
jgi:glycogen operon protein